MPTKIQIGDTIANIENMEWSIEKGDLRWREILNSDIPKHGYSPSIPDPDLNQAEDAVKRYGAKILSNKNIDSGNVVY